MTKFKRAILEGIPNELPNKKELNNYLTSLSQ